MTVVDAVSLVIRPLTIVPIKKYFFNGVSKNEKLCPH